jgi:hypothetical protein
LKLSICSPALEPSFIERAYWDGSLVSGESPQSLEMSQP